MLTTLLRPTGGRATVAGHDVVDDPAAVRRSIGVALQEAALDPLMTGRELIRLQATLHGLIGAEAERDCDALLERVGLTKAADRRVGTYSGGMRRRLDLASALVHGPQVLFLDEPTTGLDPVSRKAIWEEVARLNDEGTTVFLTTQYLEEADQLADRVGIISGGRIVAEGTPSSLKAEVGKSHLELGILDGGGERANEVLRGVRQAAAGARRQAPRRARRRRQRRRQGRARARRRRGHVRLTRAGRADPRRRLRRQDRASTSRAKTRRPRLRTSDEVRLQRPRGRAPSGCARSSRRFAAPSSSRRSSSSRRCCSRSRRAAPAAPSTSRDSPQVDNFLELHARRRDAAVDAARRQHRAGSRSPSTSRWGSPTACWPRRSRASRSSSADSRGPSCSAR